MPTASPEGTLGETHLAVPFGPGLIPWVFGNGTFGGGIPFRNGRLSTKVAIYLEWEGVQIPFLVLRDSTSGF